MKATQESQMSIRLSVCLSVCLSVIKTSLPLRIALIHYYAHQPLCPSIIQQCAKLQETFIAMTIEIIVDFNEQKN